MTLKTPKEVTETINPSGSRRLVLILCFPLFFLLAIPFWWYTTSIERLALPESRILALNNIVLPTPRAQILITADSDAFPPPAPGRKKFETKTILENLGKEVVKGVDGIYARDPESRRNTRWWDLVYNVDEYHQSPPMKVHFRLSQYANTSFPLEPYVQPPETGLMTSGNSAGTLVIPVHPDQIGDRNLKLHYKITLINAILSVFPSKVPKIPLRALSYTPNITLSFVLLNEDATEGSYVRSWDIQDAIRHHFLPHLEPLKHVFNFSIESQVLYHAPLSFEPIPGYVSQDRRESTLDEAVDVIKNANKINEKELAEAVEDMYAEQRQKTWFVSDEQMKIFVNAEKWSLDSASTNNPVLRFLLYVPSARHRPMQLATEKIDTAQSFLLPQYGGVVLLNPSIPSSDISVFHLSMSALTPSFHLFTQHLYSLLALPALPYASNKLNTPPPLSPLQPPNDLIQPLTPWQVYQIMLARSKENCEETIKTLNGIVKLVRKIREMKVGQGVKAIVTGAVEKLELVQSTSMSVSEVFTLTREAVGLANQAFFDPSMMGLLYFPNEHKVAVYTPLFAPISIPLIIGLLRELIARKKRRQAKKKESEIAGREFPTEADTEREKGIISPKEIEVQSTEAPELSLDSIQTLRSRKVRL
nr:phosphatidylinositol glycan, class S [Cryptococcus depauperatus CBS 7841]